MLGLALLLASCGEVDTASLEGILQTQNQKKPQTPPPIELPIRWTLTDTEGKKLEADIIGRTSKTLTIIRTADRKQFEVPIGRLSEADQTRIKTLSMSKTNGNGNGNGNRSPLNVSLLNMRKAALKEIQDRIDELHKLRKASQSNIETRSYVSEINRLQKRETELLAEIRKLQDSR